MPFVDSAVALAYALPREPAPMIRNRGGFADISGRGGAGRDSPSSTGDSAWGAMLILDDGYYKTKISRESGVFWGSSPRLSTLGTVSLVDRDRAFRDMQVMQRYRPVTWLLFELERSTGAGHLEPIVWLQWSGGSSWSLGCQRWESTGFNQATPLGGPPLLKCLPRSGFSHM